MFLGDSLMKVPRVSTSRVGLVALLYLCGLAGGCKDDDPCDRGQIEKYGQCYPAPAGGGTGGAGSSASAGTGAEDQGGATDVELGGSGPTLETPFGSACEDSTGSTDCGGDAPVCADLSPLGQAVMCTQIDCADGEANAGICPEGFTCFAVPSYPSVCIVKK
jgi:hypothetical protein